MMPSINKVILIGNLGKDAIPKQLKTGGIVCNFTLATTESWSDKATGQKKEETTWHNISAYKNLAEICVQYLRKGSLIYCEGKIKNNQYVDKDGIQRTGTSIVIDEMRMLDKKGVAPSTSPFTQQGADYSKSDYLNKNISPVMQRQIANHGDEFNDDVSF